MRNHAASRDTHRNGASWRRFSILAATLALTALILSSCAGGQSADESAGDDTNPSNPTTAQPGSTTPEEEPMLEARPIDSGSLGQGGAEPRAIVSSSSEALSAATGIPVRGGESTAADGEETYVAVLWGEKNTGGYSVEIESASLEGGRVSIEVARVAPPEGAIVSQALTYPYAVAAIGNLDPEGKEFVITDAGDGSELGWPVETL